MFKGLIYSVGIFFVSQAIPASADDWTVPWWTVDSGGEIKMIDLTNQTEWEVSGTIGQWDSTDTDGSASGQWELTGGFWSASISATDFLFSDGFEDPDSSL